MTGAGETARAVVIDAEDAPIPWRQVPPDQVDAEHERLNEAVEASCADIEQLRNQAEATLGHELARIFDHVAIDYVAVGSIRSHSYFDRTYYSMLRHTTDGKIESGMLNMLFYDMHVGVIYSDDVDEASDPWARSTSVHWRND